MNAVEIEEAVSVLAERPFDAAEFPYAFLEAFGNREAGIKRLRAGASNKSDIGGVLQVNHIHLKSAAPGEVRATLDALRASDATHNKRNKVRYILAADGGTLEAEDLETGETVACAYTDIPDHFGFFLPLAGITTVKQIRESSFDIRATGRLNKLYVELLKDNPDWATAARRPDMNHFMARLIFCFFAEDTDIFNGEGLFTRTVEQYAARDSSNTHVVISEIFRAMNTPIRHEGRPDDRYRKAAKIRSWADQFPYVNGGLFSGNLDVPKFSKIARSYLLHIGKLNWKQINPDIFGSMIQAVADDEERGALGMHYTSVPNILKVLNPLFIDDLREKLEEAGTNRRKLQNLRKRLARIRVFDPACGSGNFLVIAYKQMRDIERRIVVRLNDGADTVEALLDTASWPGERSVIPLTNFRGIELRDFPAEIARLALIIAEYQCDVLYRGQKDALAEFLPLDAENWIVCGNALRLDWLSVCPPSGTGVKLHADDLLGTPLDQAEIDFENEGGETYICGNPPYLGSTWQSKSQKAEIKDIVGDRSNSPGFFDYVSGWFLKAADWMRHSAGAAAFVSTNSVCQGQMVPLLWPLIFQAGCEIRFAQRSFRWSNLASHNAGVTVVIVGIAPTSGQPKTLIEESGEDGLSRRQGASISPYLTFGAPIIVSKARKPMFDLPDMEFGNKPSDGGNLLLRREEIATLNLGPENERRYLRKIYGSEEFINGDEKFCIWIDDDDLSHALQLPALARRIENVRKLRLASPDKGANALAKRAHQLKLMRIGREHTIVVPAVSSERRAFLPGGVIPGNTTINNRNFGIYDGPLWSLAVIVSRAHWVWVDTVCGKLETRFNYSNTLGWNTFPVPPLTDKNKADLTRSAEDILLAREAHFPATIADLYDPEKMPGDLRKAHERNDEVLERIYIGRRFKNDTERLEKLFELYTKMTAGRPAATKTKSGKGQKGGNENGSTQQVD